MAHIPNSIGDKAMEQKVRKNEIKVVVKARQLSNCRTLLEVTNGGVVSTPLDRIYDINR
ncbi:hypothetical protein UFOVP1138_52 [uncultured Caudovirales phage]|uniref:Uncharacterized protein n=1 Tax=uncultured Caudovirales phage TaxID=2100421 RepID=A0A6J5Q4W4_9CAUD|nr:hypothetical protein UFOVP975_68 [uncultured Caudovirales phage]CAB4186273.1 hypothetical protein UFOVP1138_52 [uncultured Caudovirales phage]CAB4204429.1 hypothetical protein UFOVP1394_49 [uncultured Caudovirales phage]